GGAPSDFEDAVQFGSVGFEAGAPLERIARERPANVVDHQPLVLVLDIELQIAPGPPPQRAEAAMLAAVECELVVIGDKLLAFHLVPIALVEPAVLRGSLRV